MKIPKNKNIKEIIKFFKRKKLFQILHEANRKDINDIELKSIKPYKPDLRDLYNLYHLIILNKRTTILEFGSGWSSLIISLALSDLKRKYDIDNLRRQNPFELFILDNEKKYLNFSEKRINSYKKKHKLINKVNFTYSKVNMINYKGNISTEFEKLPNCNPDFIYLDGPDQFKVQGKVNNITTAHKDFMPMASDILKIENFLIPGTIILVDGRKANARYLKRNLKRKWKYKEDNKFDQTFLLLAEKPLGKINLKLLNFYKKR